MNSASPFSIASLAQLTFSLLLILGLIFALSWLLKRLRIAVPRSNGAIVVLDELAVSPRDRVVLVAVGASQLLVGIGANGMVALTPLSQPIAITPRAAPPDSFADKLRDLFNQQGKGA